MKSYFKKPSYVLMVVLSIITSLLPLFFIAFQEVILDTFKFHRQQFKLVVYTIIICVLLLILFKWVVTQFKEYYLMKYRTELIKKAVLIQVKHKTNDSLKRQQEKHLDFTTVINQIIEPLLNQYLFGYIQLVSLFIMIVVGYGYAFKIHYTLMLFSITIMTFTLILNYRRDQKYHQLGKKVNESLSDINYEVDNQVDNYDTIRFLQLKQWAIDRFKIRTAISIQTYKQTKDTLALYQLISSIIYVIHKLGFILIGMFLFKNNQITEGQLVATILLSVTISRPILQISDTYQQIKSQKAAVQYIEEDAHPESLKTNELVIDFHGESYHFALHQKYLIIGKNGSGKSTLIKAITDYLCHHDLNTQCMALLQNDQYAYQSIQASVDPTSSVDIERLELLKKKIGLNKTHIEGLSGGELQKLQLLRLLYHQPSLALIDEPIVGLSKQERDALYPLLYQLDTVFLVSHHLDQSVLSHFDVIIALIDEKLYMTRNKDEGVKLYEKVNQ